MAWPVKMTVSTRTSKLTGEETSIYHIFWNELPDHRLNRISVKQFDANTGEIEVVFSDKFGRKIQSLKKAKTKGKFDYKIERTFAEDFGFPAYIDKLAIELKETTRIKDNFGSIHVKYVLANRIDCVRIFGVKPEKYNIAFEPLDYNSSELAKTIAGTTVKRTTNVGEVSERTDDYSSFQDIDKVVKVFEQGYPENPIDISDLLRLIAASGNGLKVELFSEDGKTKYTL